MFGWRGRLVLPTLLFPPRAVAKHLIKWRRPSDRAFCATQDVPHTSVLLEEVTSYFDGRDLKVFVDCTLGAGGHTLSIANGHKELECIVGIDMDPVALQIARDRLKELDQSMEINLLRGNFSEMAELCSSSSPSLSHLLDGGVDGMIMDLGMSSIQVDASDRGFSFMGDGPLDMRMDPNGDLTAEEIVNSWSEVDLGCIFKEYGEEKMWRAVARRICNAREVAPIKTTQELVKAIGDTMLYSKGKRRSTAKGIHPATRVFQALRIAVNKELTSLEKALPLAINALRPGGRLGVISFHSLEDRIVKHAFLKAAGRAPLSDFVYEKDMSFGSFSELQEHETSKSTPIAKILTKKPIVPGQVEIEENSRSRSAKLRFVEKL